MQNQSDSLPRLRSHSKADKKGELSGQQGQSPNMSTPQKEVEEEVPTTNDQWWKVFQNIQTEVRSLKLSENEVKTMKNAESAISSVKTLQMTESARITALEALVKDQDVKIRILTNIVIRQEETVENIEQRMNEVRRMKLRQNIRISGITEDPEETQKVTKQKVESFLKETMEITEPPVVKMARRVGYQTKQKDREVVAKLANVADKGIIFTNSKNLKDKRNPKKKLYFVNDDLDQEQAEERRKFKVLKDENKAEPEGKRKSVKFIKNRIVIDNEIILPQVMAPTATEVLRLTDEERMEIKTTKMITTDEHSEDLSDYASFVQRVKSVDDVRKGYYKLRIRFGDATHISCGYRLEEPLGPDRQEGIDDKEYGAGRTILKILKQKAAVNMAVFVVRWYGGKRLGNRRFQILEMLTEAALGTYQFKRDRATRMQRSLSQSSLQSFNSQASVDTDVSFDTAENVEERIQVQEGEAAQADGHP